MRRRTLVCLMGPAAAGKSTLAKELERRHDELVAAQDLRLSELESEMRRRIEDLRSDVDAERGVLEARLQELLRRFASAAAS